MTSIIYDLVTNLKQDGLYFANFDKVKIAADNTLTLMGQRVAVTYHNCRVTSDIDLNCKMPNYHISYCKVLEHQYKTRGNLEQQNIENYCHCTQNDRGDYYFTNFFPHLDHVTEYYRLGVCSECLARLSWDGYSFSEMSQQDREEIEKRFTLKSFFEKYPKNTLTNSDLIFDFEGDDQPALFLPKQSGLSMMT